MEISSCVQCCCRRQEAWCSRPLLSSQMGFIGRTLAQIGNPCVSQVERQLPLAALTARRGPHRMQQVQETGLCCRSCFWSCSFSIVSTFILSSILLSSAIHF